VSTRTPSLAKSLIADRLLLCLGGSCLGMIEAPQPRQWDLLSWSPVGPGPDPAITPLGSNGARVSITGSGGVGIDSLELAAYVTSAGADMIQATVNESSGSAMSSCSISLETTLAAHGGSALIGAWGHGGTLAWGQSAAATLPWWSAIIRITVEATGVYTIDLYQG